VVKRGQALSVPLAKYNEPADLLASEQLQIRSVFETVDLASVGSTPMFTAPFQVNGKPMHLVRAAGDPGADNAAIWGDWLGHKPAELEQWGRDGAI
jgi:crotonobetainyl-CoA:carnitine CoA-transferase CaiB-like acyl-CoA transferase